MIARDMSVYKTPEFRALISERSKEMWADPLRHRRMSIQLKRRWKDVAFRKNFSEAMWLRWQDPVYRSKMSDIHRVNASKSGWHLTLVHSLIKDTPEYRKKVSDGVRRALHDGKMKRHDWFRGREHSVETLKKMSMSRKMWHRKHPNAATVFNTGRSLSSVSRLKIANTLRSKGVFCGSNNPNWHGGINRSGYSYDFSLTLRHAIRSFYGYRCCLCGKSMNAGFRFPVHHIDYDKKNSNPENLIPLCNPCHIRTSYNRDLWLNHFSKVVDSCFDFDEFRKSELEVMPMPLSIRGRP